MSRAGRSMAWTVGRGRWDAFQDWWFVFTGQRLSLAFKLAAPVLVTTAILAAAMGIIVTGQIQSQIQKAYERQAGSVASGVEAMYLQHPNDVVQLNDYLARLVHEQPDIIAARIHGLDRGATVIASSDPGDVGQIDLVDAEELRAIWGGYRFQDENGGPILTTVQPLRDGDLLFGAVVITSSRSSEVAATQAITFGIGFAAFASIVIESVFVLSTLYFGIIRRTRRVQRA